MRLCLTIKQTLRVGAAAAAALIIGVGAALAAEPIQFGTTGRSDSTSIATYIALEKKFFEAEKLDVVWTPAGSAARAVQQTVAGSLDISIAATDATVRAIAGGAGLRIIAGTVHAAPFRTVGAKGVATWDSLKGKLVSVGGPTDQTLFFFRIMARKNGLAEKDYDLIYAGTTPARFSQLMSGQVGAAVLTNPNDLMALAEGFVISVRIQERHCDGDRAGRQPIAHVGRLPGNGPAARVQQVQADDHVVEQPRVEQELHATRCPLLSSRSGFVPSHARPQQSHSKCRPVSLSTCHTVTARS